jgi:hypothetical protein
MPQLQVFNLNLIFFASYHRGASHFGRTSETENPRAQLHACNSMRADSTGLGVAVPPRSHSEPLRLTPAYRPNKTKLENPMNTAWPVSASRRHRKAAASQLGLAPPFWQKEPNWDNSNDFNEDEEGEILHLAHLGRRFGAENRQRSARLTQASSPRIWQNKPIAEKPNEYSFASFGITSAPNSRSEHSGSTAFWQNEPNWDNSNDFNEHEEGEILHPGAPRASRVPSAPKTGSETQGFRRHRSPVILAERTQGKNPNDYNLASFGITSAANSCSERSASESDMVPRKR